jgi:hypothetical protein
MFAWVVVQLESHKFFFGIKKDSSLPPGMTLKRVVIPNEVRDLDQIEPLPSLETGSRG